MGAFKGGKKFSIVWRPLALVGFQLGAPKGQWFPSLGTQLFEYASYGGVGRVGRQSEFGTGPRVMKECCSRKCSLCVVKGCLVLGSPLQGLGFPF